MDLRLLEFYFKLIWKYIICGTVIKNERAFYNPGILLIKFIVCFIIRKKLLISYGMMSSFVSYIIGISHT